jgi:c-type cytochrome biogenesis protein CcmF
MEAGKLSIWFGLAASSLTFILYLVSLRGDRRVLQAARIAFILSAAAAVFSFGRLMYLILRGRYQYEYVFNYSSPDLPWYFKISSTWAGQEGSFLIWMMWTAVIGLLVLWKAGKWESRVMPFFVSSLIFLFAICTWLSPYNLIPRGGENGYPLDLPWPPNFGKGLNPSLQNYWMAIHPPTIFFGFVSLAVPFAFAIAALIWKDYEEFAPRVMPWVLMAVAALGVGKMMGGYWAYETQGWHGFWAWDPVENASLFPWLASVGLLHGLVVQKSRGGMTRTNLFLAILGWSLFIWGTFLTRSGVLADFSVHSFVALGASALWLLIGMIGIYTLGGIGLILFRWRTIPGRPISDKFLSRDTGMVVAVSLAIAMCLIVLVATSWPLISRWSFLQTIGLGELYNPKGMRAEAIFYNKVGSAILIPTLLVMGVIPFLAWGKTNLEKFLWKILVPWFAALAGGFLVVWFVLHEAMRGYNPETGQLGFQAATPRMVVVVIATLGLFAVFSNLSLIFKILQLKEMRRGGWLAFAGLAIMLGGVITGFWYLGYGLAAVLLGLMVTLSGFDIFRRKSFAEGGALTHVGVLLAPLGLLVALWEPGWGIALFTAGALSLLMGLRARQATVTVGGWLAHVGIGLMFVGTIIANPFEKTQDLVIAENMGPVNTAFGYTLEFVGWTHEDKLKRAAETSDLEEARRLQEEVRRDWYRYNHAAIVRVTENRKPLDTANADGPGPSATEKERGFSFLAHLPVFYHMQLESDDPNRAQTMRWPYIHRQIHRDFYMLVTADPKLVRASVTLVPGEEAPITVGGVVDTKYRVRYKNFYMEGVPGQPGTKMGAVMDLITPDGRTVEIRPGKSFSPDGRMISVNTQIPEVSGAVILEGGVNANNKQVTAQFEFPESPAIWALQMQVTNKPLINLVWLGVILMGAGALIAMVRRAQEARKGLVFQTAAAAGAGDVPVAVAVAPVVNGSREEQSADEAPVNGASKGDGQHSGKRQEKRAVR